MDNKYIIIDFDSTFTKVEALDVLGEISLAAHPEKDQRLKKIADVTNSGMNGEVSFAESLKTRIDILDAKKSHLPQLVDNLKSKVSESFKRNKDFFTQYGENILIVSSGFKEFITPVVADYGIPEKNVYANTFVFDESGTVIGVDQSNELSGDKGKVKLMQRLALKGDISVIGDGYTDYEIREAGLANTFYAFVENVRREKVIAKADVVLNSFDDFLYQNNLIAFPKNKIKILLLENVHPVAKKLFSGQGFQVETIKGALDEDELIEKIKDVHVLGIRSKTHVTKRVLEHANKLMVVGAFCIGTNQIDLLECQRKGIAVFNAPYSNTRSVVELAIGEIIMLIRNIPEKNRKMHLGEWDKSANNSFEIRGKKLGIVGYGNIGAQLSVVAEALGMEVYFYDAVDKLALGNAKKCNTLYELLGIADIISLHVDGRPSNKNVFGEDEFKQMKEGVIFLNLARGHVVDIKALVNAVKSGKVIGAGVDVFPLEPKTNDEEYISELRGLPNVILTPHIGGSTSEAQENIGNYVPNKIIEYINTGSTFNSVNFPNIQLPEFQKSHRLMHVHHNMPGIIAKINQVITEHGANILGQYLKTNEEIGYVITDIDIEHGEELINDLKKIPSTIKFRALY